MGLPPPKTLPKTTPGTVLEVPMPSVKQYQADLIQVPDPAKLPPLRKLIVATMTWRALPTSTGTTVATASSLETAPCPRWARVVPSMLLTTSAKLTRTARSVSVPNTATSALASSSATHGSTLPSSATSSPTTL